MKLKAQILCAVLLDFDLTFPMLLFSLTNLSFQHHFSSPWCKDLSQESRTRSVQKFKIKTKLCISIKMGGLEWELSCTNTTYIGKVCYCMKIDVCCGFGFTNPF